MDIKSNLNDITKKYDLKDTKVGVLGGGVSSEREISLASAKNVYEALKRNNIDTVFIDMFTTQEEEVKRIISSFNIDVAFIALHGEFGEDGKIQHILEKMKIPYTGSSPDASYRAMDKIISKKIFQKKGIPTAPFCIWEGEEKLLRKLRYPLVVKPYFNGSSLGVSIVRDESYLQKAIEEATFYQEKIILEDYIEGKELTVGILEDKPMEVIEIVPKKGYFDFYTKYTDGMAEFIVPAKLDKEVYRKVQEVALGAHLSLGCRHFSRVDIRLGEDNIPYVLEVNSIPGLTSHSLLPLSAKARGIDFEELVLKIIFLALNEKKQVQKI
jgi:D-alanine-D-alanine ligase